MTGIENDRQDVPKDGRSGTVIRSPAMGDWASSGDLTHAKRTDLVIAAATEVQARFNAFSEIDVEGARATARQLDAAGAGGTASGPLAGVAVSVKDILDVAGLPTRWGSELFRNAAPAKADLAAVARLRQAGAVVLAKTTTTEFAHAPLGYSPLTGLTKNPWNEDVTAGGSSSGAGVAVATGATPIALATDAGCSTRLPAACTATFGLKPTLGLIPHERVPEAFGNFIHLGLLARTVGELAQTLPIVAGAHPADPQGLGRAEPVRPTGNVLEGTRVVRWRTVGNRMVSGEVDAALERSVAALRGLGATVIPEACPLPNPDPTWITLQQANWAARFANLSEEERTRISPTLRAGIDRGLAASAVDLQRALIRRTAIFREVQSVFLDRADFILTPAFSARPVAALHGIDEPLVIDGVELGNLRSEWVPYLSLFDLSGHPAIAMPAGLTDDGVPLGVQLVAPWHGDFALLAAASAFEAALPPPRLA
ncbi:amidase [Mesorhizobium sp. ANAO-SY3R2]|uniref:amidase n=1 Tax=Mesorhizobium sp. ANAO-SY3R2 TaxID=3166644 RepID=UPI003670E60F